MVVFRTINRPHRHPRRIMVIYRKDSRQVHRIMVMGTKQRHPVVQPLDPLQVTLLRANKIRDMAIISSKLHSFGVFFRMCEAVSFT